jgi:hypothetical protein
VQAHIEILEKFGSAACEAMRDSTRNVSHRRLQNRNKVFVCIALMQEKRQAAPDGKLQLTLERHALRCSRGKIAKIVQPALADGDDCRICKQLLQACVDVIVVFAGVMRMHAGRGMKNFGPAFCQCDGVKAALLAASGQDHMVNAGVERASDDIVTIAIKAVVSQIGSDVDQ